MPWPVSETVSSSVRPGRPFCGRTTALTVIVPGGSAAPQELRVAEHRVERRAQLVSDRRRHLPERGQTPAAPDLELRLPQPLVGLLELAILLGQVAGGLPDARLEAGGQLLEAGQHAVQAAGEEGELPAAGGFHPDAELAALRPLHARPQRGDGTSHAPLQAERAGERAEERRADQNGPGDHAQPPPQTCELVERELDLRRANERTVAPQRHGDAPDARSYPLAVERHRAAPGQLPRGVWP